MANTIEFDLPDNLTIAKIHGLHEQLEAMVDDQTHDNIVIHGKAVSRIDTAGVQLLYAFVVAAKDRQITINWDKPSHKLRETVELLGMSNTIGIH